MTAVSEPERRAERRIGSTVGKYRLERVLGVGGMASVYLAVHRNGHRVAVKMLHPDVSADPDLRARFVREGYAANAIDHRGVVRVLDDDETEDGSAFLVMELLEGETLAERARKTGGVVPVREALELGHQLLDVLAVAHAKGIVHRDIKPDNLFVTREGVLKVLDFGIARVRLASTTGSEPTHTGRAMGTPAFMAPEQAIGRARDVDERTDVYACGATLFSLLGGKLVHAAESAQELVVLAATRPARSLATVAPSLPAEVVAVVDKALAFERDDRWPSAAAMRDAIAAVAEKLFGEAPVPATAVPTRSSRVDFESAPTMDARDARGLGASLASGAPASTPAAVTVPRTRPRRWVAGVVVLAAAALAWAAWPAHRDETPHAPVPSAGVPVAVVPSCTNASCAEGGRLAVCRHGACVPLETADCTVVGRPDDVAADATLWVGTMFPRKGPMAAAFVESGRSVELARTDFLDVASGLPSARPGAPSRPIGLVACDDAADPSRVARHLVDEVGVPAILGFARSKEVVDLAQALFNPRGVLAFAANTAPMLSSIPTPPGQERLVWRVTYSGPMFAAAAAGLVESIERQLRASHVLAPGEPMRVLFARVENTAGIGMLDAVVSGLRFNGKTVAENGETFRDVVVPDLNDAGGDRGEHRVAQAVLSFRPHVVLDTVAGDALVPLVEGGWPKGERFRPRYVEQGALSEPSYTAALAADPGLARRLFGLDVTTDAPAVAKFVLRHNEVLDPKVTAFDADSAPYDAFYALAYLVVALGDAPVDGASLARAIPRLQGGAPIDVGPAGIYPAVAALGRGENIALRGTTTALDFDRTTGDPSVRFAAFCFRPDAAGKLAIAPSGFTFDTRTGQAVGELHCP
ncbi:MAG TPA: protein kinase [Polyangiaceae bacterium]